MKKYTTCPYCGQNKMTDRILYNVDRGVFGIVPASVVRICENENCNKQVVSAKEIKRWQEIANYRKQSGAATEEFLIKG